MQKCYSFCLINCNALLGSQRIKTNQEVREECATLVLAQQVSPYCTENNASVNYEPEPLFVQIISDPLALVALYQFPPAKEPIL